MIKILLIQQSGDPFKVKGGVQKHCNELTKLFENHDFIQILPIERYNDFHILGKKAFRWKPFFSKIKESGCDIIHIHGYLFPCVVQGLIAGILTKKKIVYTAHFHPFRTLNHPLQGRLFFYLLVKPLLWAVKAFVTLNNDDTAFFAGYSNTYKISHWNTFSDKKVNQNPIKRIPNMILYIGRNHANKGIDHLYSLPIGKYQLHCVTPGQMKYREDIVQHQNISEKKLSELYQKASLVVVPSKYEAFSLVTLEALLHGVPVVMSDQVRIADHLGDCIGYSVFRFSDYNRFSDAVEATIGTTVDVERIRSSFDKEKAKILYEKVYRSVI